MADLVRWDPFREAMSLRQAVDRLFQDAWVAPTGNGPTPGSYGFPVDLYEAEDDFVMTAALPGVKAEDLSITTKGNVLSIHYEVKAPDTTGQRHHVRERRYGQFSRQFALPRDVHADGVEAHLEDGVLRLRLPKADVARARRIEVQTGTVPQIAEHQAA